MDHIRFDAGETTLIITTAIGSPPYFQYWGRRLSSDISVDHVRILRTAQAVHGSENRPVTPSLMLEPGLGLMGPSGLSAHRDGKDWGSHFLVTNVQPGDGRATIRAEDPNSQLSLEFRIEVDMLTGLLTISSQLMNMGSTPVNVDNMATACLPIPQEMTDIIGFSGRWAKEFQLERLSRFSGTYMRENRRGRTSHDSYPAVICCASRTMEQEGEAYAMHLAWSGNHRIRVDSLNDGRVFASLGTYLLPGEIRLLPGECFDSPAIIAGYSASGFSALSRQFHDHVRNRLLRPSVRSRPRPVHYNSWEAVYFDHDIDRLKDMATKAADIGIERFVLDDGWFGARRNDRAGLGDWTVSTDVYPDGLRPLIDHVNGLGMEMGLWFEPEMVNPDSDLFRNHPDWILKVDNVEQIPFRSQYALDISRPDVSEYLFDRMNAILRDHNIGYVKWDMNRDLNHPGGPDGTPRAYAQTIALYALISRLRTAHPDVEFESCSSGGARADMGVLAYTDRVWTSDSNDAIDRQKIQHGASYFLPLDVTGAHVGPRHCHITGRTLSMQMRAATALMGHMGVELNLLSEPEHELQILKSAIALYKDVRDLLHNGDMYRLDTPEFINAFGVVAKMKERAIFSIAYMTGHDRTVPPCIRFDGLDADADYRIRMIWPTGWKTITEPSVMTAMSLDGDGHILPAQALMTVGMQLPFAYPETVLLFQLDRE